MTEPSFDLYESYNKLTEVLNSKPNTKEYKRLKSALNTHEREALKKLQRRSILEKRRVSPAESICESAPETTATSSIEHVNICENEAPDDNSGREDALQVCEKYLKLDYIVATIDKLKESARKDMKQHVDDIDRILHYESLCSILQNVISIRDELLTEDVDAIYDGDWTEIPVKKTRRKKRKSRHH